MAERKPVLEIVEVHNYLSWRYSPDEIVWAFDKYGVDQGKNEMRELLEVAMEDAERVYKLLKRPPIPVAAKGDE